jgi:thiol-disulfide isomerase/thioredoxin
MLIAQLTCRLAASLLIVLSVSASLAAHADNLEPRPLPEFTRQDPAGWFNSEPLAVADLRGRVVLVDVWTYGCWNCYRSFPWLRNLEQRLAGESFTIVGIHTPEFEHERDADRVAQKIAEFRLTHPVMLDNDFAYWRALENRYWPAYYLVDHTGRVRHRHVGETHEGDPQALRIENQIRHLLKEQATDRQ